MSSCAPSLRRRSWSISRLRVSPRPSPLALRPRPSPLALVPRKPLRRRIFYLFHRVHGVVLLFADAGSGSGRRSGRRRRTPQGGGAESPLGATEAHSPASRGADGGGGGDDTGDGSCSELSLRSAALDSFLDDLGTESEFARRGCSAEPASRGKGNKGRSKGKAGGVPRGPQRRPASGSAAIPRVGRAGSADSLHSGFRLPARRAASATERRREVEEDGYALPSAQTRRPMSGNFNVLD